MIFLAWAILAAVWVFVGAPLAVAALIGFGPMREDGYWAFTLVSNFMLLVIVALIGAMFAVCWAVNTVFLHYA